MSIWQLFNTLKEEFKDKFETTLISLKKHFRDTSDWKIQDDNYQAL